MRISDWSSDVCSSDLPFLFIFNTQLLLIDVTWWQAVIVFVTATLAMLMFTAAMQGYFLARSRIYETIALLLVAFTLFRPGFWMDLAVAPYRWQEPTTLVEALGAARSEEHTSELQSLMRISYAVFFLKKNKNTKHVVP